MAETEATPIFIEAKDAAELLAVNVRVVHELSRSRYNGFPAIRMGHKFLINRDMLIEWARRITTEGGKL